MFYKSASGNRSKYGKTPEKTELALRQISVQDNLDHILEISEHR